MEYIERYTEAFDNETEEINAEPTYFVKADAEVIVQRLGLYEDLGFSPAELAEILLASDSVPTDKKDLVRLALLRIRKFDEKKYYPKEPFVL